MTFNIGSQTAGVINNVAGDQRIAGGQQGSVVALEAVLRAAADLRKGLSAASLDDSTAATSNLDEIDATLRTPEPDRSRIARYLEYLTRRLVAAGSLVTAGGALVGPIQTIARWLGSLGEPILRLLPALA